MCTPSTRISTDIPQLPTFRRLRLADKDLIESFLSQFEPYCDFRFWAMWHRDIEEVWEISSMLDHLIVKFVDHISGQDLYTIIGANENTSKVTIATLAFLNDQTLYPKLSLVPEETINAIKPEYAKYLKISLDRDNIDYVYSVKQLVELKGRGMKNKRRAIVGYWEHYPNSKIRLMDLRSDDDVKVMELLTLRWAKMRKYVNHKREVLTMSRLLQTSENRDDLHAIGLFIGSKLIGFTINEPFNEKWYSGYFGKADTAYQGAYSVLENETAKYFYSKGYEFANHEQDMGLAGLRKSKQLWRPIRMLNKYTIMPRWSSTIEKTEYWRELLR